VISNINLFLHGRDRRETKSYDYGDGQKGIFKNFFSVNRNMKKKRRKRWKWKKQNWKYMLLSSW